MDLLSFEINVPHELSFSDTDENEGGVVGALDIGEAAGVLGLSPEMIYANFCEIVFPKVGSL